MASDAVPCGPCGLGAIPHAFDAVADALRSLGGTDAVVPDPRGVASLGVDDPAQPLEIRHLWNATRM
jgi:hypothetical protein